jgi:hypothetical protein
MRLFKSKSFSKFAQKERLSDAVLCSVIKEVEAGKIDADYGGGVIKQRIARAGAGKSGGYRSIILYRRGERAFFEYGFAKNAQSNIDASDERDLKVLAKVLLTVSNAEIEKLLEQRVYQEVLCDVADKKL